MLTLCLYGNVYLKFKMIVLVDALGYLNEQNGTCALLHGSTYHHQFGVFANLSKAFHIVIHKLLLFNMEKSGIRGTHYAVQPRMCEKEQGKTEHLPN